MKIVFYNDDNDIVDVIEKVNEVELDEEKNSIRWEWGQALGINSKFVVVEDEEAEDVEERSFRGRKLPPGLLEKDRSSDFRKRGTFNIENEISELKREIAELRRNNPGNNAEPPKTEPNMMNNETPRQT